MTTKLPRNQIRVNLLCTACLEIPCNLPTHILSPNVGLGPWYNDMMLKSPMNCLSKHISVKVRTL